MIIILYQLFLLLKIHKGTGNKAIDLNVDDPESD